jgi:hypothetical protein
MRREMELWDGGSRQKRDPSAARREERVGMTASDWCEE